MTGVYVPHVAVWVEDPDERMVCAVCMRLEEMHPEYFDEDVEVDDDDERR